MSLLPNLSEKATLKSEVILYSDLPARREFLLWETHMSVPKDALVTWDKKQVTE